MQYQIKKMSYYANRILRRLTNGTVHSVYRRTINLTDGRQILSIQTSGSPLSPVSLISNLTADDLEALPVKAGDTVSFNPFGFTLHSSEPALRPDSLFTCKDASQFDLKLPGSLDMPSCTALVTGVKEALSHTGTGGFSLLFTDRETGSQDLSLILLTAKKHIQRSQELCLSEDYQEAALTLSRLLGLGTGLTPSGDDFLCGVLAGLILSGNDGHPFSRYLKTEIQNRLSDTIDISAVFLACALEGQFSLPVNNLYQLPDPREILSSFEEIGHSSGMDTLCGILWSLKNIRTVD